MTKDLTSLAAFRAEQLAYLVLTRRDDLAVTREQRLGDLQIDLAATILENGKETAQLFAVEVKAIRAQDELRTLKSRDSSLSNFPFPLVLFVFNMEDDAGYWRWLVEPISGIDALPGAVRAGQPKDLEPLTNEAVAGIVSKVSQWYEARLVKR